MPLILPPRLTRAPFVYGGNFENGIDGWEGNGATIAPVSTPTRYGKGAARVTANGSNVGIKQELAHATIIEPSKAYLSSIRCRGVGTIYLLAGQYTDEDVYITGPTSAQIDLDPDEWRVAAVSFVSHETANKLVLFCNTYGAQDIVWYVDGAMNKAA